MVPVQAPLRLSVPPCFAVSVRGGFASPMQPTFDVGSTGNRVRTDTWQACTDTWQACTDNR